MWSAIKCSKQLDLNLSFPRSIPKIAEPRNCQRVLGMKKILLIEPYYGGSHKMFLDGLVRHVEGDFTLLSLPARKWKMRMQLSAPWFIAQLSELPAAERNFDTVLFSSFIDVAVFKAMASSLAGWNNRCRYLTYFHENQFCYPGFLDKHTTHHFTSINFTSALVSDSIAFNSEYNRSSFLHQCSKYLLKATDMELSGCLDELRRKSIILYPGLDFSGQDRIKIMTDTGRVKTIVWNHRWEHDKNPEEFFQALYKLQICGIDFRLCVLGQHFQNKPICFDEARQRLKGEIVQWGYVDEQDAYYQHLAAGDIVVSTAVHEFFGISVIEAVRAGCVPVLPHRLSYPELFEEQFLYENGRLYEHLAEALHRDEKLTVEQSRKMTEPFSWDNLAAGYRSWLH